jgi:hypothetical protein
MFSTKISRSSHNFRLSGGKREGRDWRVQTLTIDKEKLERTDI